MTSENLGHPSGSGRAAPIAQSMSASVRASVSVRHCVTPVRKKPVPTDRKEARASTRSTVIPLHGVLQLWGHATGGVARYIVHPPLTTTQYVPQRQSRAVLYSRKLGRNWATFQTDVLVVRSHYHESLP